MGREEREGKRKKGGRKEGKGAGRERGGSEGSDEKLGWQLYR